MDDGWNERFKLSVCDDATEIVLRTLGRGDSGLGWELSAVSVGGLRLELNLRRNEVEQLVAKLSEALK